MAMQAFNDAARRTAASEGVPFADFDEKIIKDHIDFDETGLLSCIYAGWDNPLNEADNLSLCIRDSRTAV